MSVVRPKPRTAGDWHTALIDHLGHVLTVRTRMEPAKRVVVTCAASDGRASLTIWPNNDGDGEGKWRPHISAPLFFGTRSVGCRTCQCPVAR